MEGRTIIKEKVKYGYLKDKCMIMVNVKKTNLLFRFGFNPGKFRFSPKPEKETVLLLKDFLKTLSPLLSTAHKEVRILF